MPYYPFPNFIGSSPRLTTFQGVPSIQYKITSEYEWKMSHLVGGKRFLTDVFFPTHLLRPDVCPPDVEVYRIDSPLRMYHLRERVRRFENMEFPKGCLALVIDTDRPVSQFFADNFCAYTTGLIGMRATAGWMNKFYKELSVGEGPTPFSWSSCPITQNEKLYPCSPWPTPGYSSNGLSSIVKNSDRMLLGGGEISSEELLTDYQWSARMSVAIFFKRKLLPESLQYGILESRAHRFCSLCYTCEGKFHKITDFRWVDTTRLKFWNEYDYQPDIKSYDSFWDNKPTKSYRTKIEIEEITTDEL